MGDECDDYVKVFCFVLFATDVRKMHFLTVMKDLRETLNNDFCIIVKFIVIITKNELDLTDVFLSFYNWPKISFFLGNIKIASLFDFFYFLYIKKMCGWKQKFLFGFQPVRWTFFLVLHTVKIIFLILIKKIWHFSVLFSQWKK